MKLNKKVAISIFSLFLGLSFYGIETGCAQIQSGPVLLKPAFSKSILPAASKSTTEPHTPMIFRSEQSKRAESHIGQSSVSPGVSWIKTVRSNSNKVFIENKGQFENREGLKAEDILYCLRDGITEFYFTRKGLVYRISKLQKVTDQEWDEFAEKNHLPPDKDENEAEAKPHLLERSALVEMNWQGANASPEISEDEVVDNYFNYLTPIKGEKVIGHVRGFRKLTYKNVYPGIDIEYTVHLEAGIKYTYILHPGADVSLIRMSYTGTDVHLDNDRNIVLPTLLGNITDHAPDTYLGSVSTGEKIGSSFYMSSSNVIAFNLAGNIQHAENILIDPWTVGPPISVSEAVDDITVDAANNVIIYSVDTVSYSNTYLTKFNAAGVLQWTFNLKANAGYKCMDQGDVAADPAGNIYVNMGIGPGAAWYNTIKIDPAGSTLLWGNATPAGSTNGLLETWTITFNCDYTQLLQSGGGAYIAGNRDHNMGAWETVNTATGAEGALFRNDTLGEVISSFWAPNGLVYHICADSNKNAIVFPSAYTSGSHNTLACVNPATGYSHVFTIHTNYGFRDYDKKAPNSTGINGLVASCAYVYTTDGLNLDQWDALTGAHIHTVAIAGGNNVAFNDHLAPTSQVNGGLIVDKCGNVYIGGNKKVFEFDPNLNLLNTINGLPDMVFDLALGSNGMIYACGGSKDSKSFVAELSAFACTPASALTVAVVQPACFGQTGSATANPTFCGAPYTYKWLPGLQTTQSISGLAAGTYTAVVKGSLLCPTSAGDTVIITINTVAATVSATIAPTNITCNAACNGAATVTPSGGSGGYTYSWTGGAGSSATASSLCPNTYTCTIQDGNGCSTTQTATITQPGVLSVTPTQTNVNCNGGASGSATATVSGGTSGYTYVWTGGTIGAGQGTLTATGLAAGTYTCTITDSKSCTIAPSFSITQPATPLAVTPAQANVNCTGASSGTATATINGGSPAYTYVWTGGTIGGGQGTATATGLAIGTYTCSVTDNKSCPISSVFTITQPATVLSATTAQTNVSCNGAGTGTATATGTGGSPGYSYVWSGGTIGGGQGTSTATGLTQGTYTCTITDLKSCTSVSVFTISQPAAPLSVVPSQTNVNCNGKSTGSATATTNGGSPAYTYVWSGGTIGGGQATNTATGLASGSYTCTITDSKSCSTAPVFVITQPAAPLAVTPSQTNVNCNGVCTGTASASVSGGTSTYTYSWSPNSSSASTAPALCQGSYTCTITDAKGCVLVTPPYVISQPGVLTITPVATTQTACSGNTGTASVTAAGGNGGYTYTWSPAPGGGQGTANATGLAAASYTLTVNDSKLCVQTYTVTITSAGGPSSTLASSANLNCNGICSGAAKVNATGGAAPYTYSWSSGPSVLDSANGLCAGTYTCTITDKNGCKVTQPVTISQPSVLTASPTAVSSSCGGANGSAQANASGGTGTLSYSWKPNPTGGQGTASATGLSAGNYTVYVTDGKSCAQQFTIAVNNSGGPSTSSVRTNPVCNSSCNGAITVTATGGTGAMTYSWSPVSNNTNSAAGLCAGTYTCFVRDANNCLITQVDTIKTPTAVAVTPVQVNVSCLGSCNGLARATASGGTPGYTYSWSANASVLDSIQSLCAGNYTCTVTDAKGCVQSQAFVISSPAALSISSSQTNLSCNAACNGTATATPAGGSGAYTWSWTALPVISATASGLCAGTYSCTVTDSKGCSSNQSFTITQPTVLVVTDSSKPATCQQKNGLASVFPSGGTGAYTYSWSPAGGITAVSSALDSGIYICTITDAKGCTLAVSDTVKNAGVLPKITVSAGGPNIFCAGGSVTLTASGSGVVSWSNGASGNSIVASTGGIYTATTTNACGSASANDTVLVNPKPNPAVIGLNKICAGDISILTATGGTSYSWSTGSITDTIHVSASGIYVVTVTNSCGKANAQDTVTVNSVTAHFTPNVNVGAPPLPVTFIDNSSATATVWSWTFGDGTSGTGQGATHTYPSAGMYTVTLTVQDANGCISTYTDVIDVKENPSWIIIPNVFTPNGDGTNDVFQILSQGISTFDAKIYDRWGVLMSHLWAPGQGWDGRTIAGLLAVNGTYYYIIKAQGDDGKSYDLSGFIMLIRSE